MMMSNEVLAMQCIYYQHTTGAVEQPARNTHQDIDGCVWDRSMGSWRSIDPSCVEYVQSNELYI